MSIKVAFITLGCAKNQVDSENLATLLANYNCVFENSVHKADAVIINTCGFIGDAKEESVNVILQTVEETDGAIIVFGCLSELYKEDLKKEIPEIKAFFGVNEFENILAFLKKEFQLKKSGPGSFIKLSSYKPHHAFIKIAEGCSNSCSFCVIPQIRGPFISRPVQEIIDEVKPLVDSGVKEIDLVAQDSTMYGFDLKIKKGIIHLLERLEEIEGLEWIRVLYGYPTFYTKELIQHIASSQKVANYFDIPFQHCSNSLLERMSRQERKKDIINILENIHKYATSPFIRTAFITGFPGETQKEFNELKDFITEWGFSRVGIFQYSHEELSSAYQYKDDVPEEVKEERQELLLKIADKQIEEKNKSEIGKTIKVIVDGFNKEEMIMTGRTEQMVPEIDGEVILQEVTADEGEIIDVTVKGVSGPDLIAG